jgi:hypothetical protein
MSDDGTNEGLCQVADFSIDGSETPAYAASRSRSSWSVLITQLLLLGKLVQLRGTTLISHLEIRYVLQSQF